MRLPLERIFRFSPRKVSTTEAIFVLDIDSREVTETESGTARILLQSNPIGVRAAWSALNAAIEMRMEELGMDTEDFAKTETAMSPGRANAANDEDARPNETEPEGGWGFGLGWAAGKVAEGLWGKK
ncbi:hypothetical protein CYMTET_2990 [Cymbomonas tetramitiformis]|uniref:Uncharacterized protein n=1 Tax=Cymbomonas tetramitiformis TaxID=36881 RepID=A0AAE0H485_9CHLO|nr:hypothetical protein CYMTET_2990 [Cymbomonas tetramitiformis]